MKTVSVILTIGILLISAVALTSFPKNIVAQQAEEPDYTMTEEEIKTKITEFKTKHPKFAAVVEGISNLDLKEQLKAILVQKFYKNCSNFMLKI